MPNDDVLVRCEHVGKKFCRSLKKSLWYGVADIASDILRPGSNGHDADGGRVFLRNGEFWALDDVSFEVRRGECMGLIGRNGSGKTTLLKLLSGLIKPDRGRITMRGRVGALIALGAGFNPILTGRENIYVNGSILALSRRKISGSLDEIVAFAELEEAIDAPVRTYSSGMQVRLGFAVAAVLVKPDILLLDEVLAVGDASFHARALNAINTVRASGVAVILVSHSMQSITRFCSTCARLERGVMVAHGAVQRVVHEYLSDCNIGAGSSLTVEMEAECVPCSDLVEIEPIQFCDEQRQPVAVVSPTQPVVLRLPYRSRLPADHTITVELKATSGTGLLLFQGTLHDQNVFLRSLPPHGFIEVTIPALVIQNTRVHLSISLWNHDVTRLFAWTRYNWLQVTGDERSTGALSLAPHWVAAPVSDG